MKQKTFKSILFPTDFSNDSINALNFAVELANITKAKLTLLNVVDTPYNFNMENEPAEVDLIVQDLIYFSKTKLQKLIKQIKERHFLTIDSATYTGETTPSIVRAVNHFDVDLIVMGTKVTRDLFFKSSSFNIVKNTSVPVLTINHDAELSHFQNILFPFNERFVTLKKADGVIQLAKLFSSKVILLGVSNANSPAQIQTITDNMLYIKSIFDEHNIESEVQFSAADSYTQGILNYCLSNRINLVTVVNNLPTALREKIKFSPAENIINKANIPVLTIPVVNKPF